MTPLWGQATDSWGKQIEDTMKKSKWKNPCSILDRSHPRWQENRQELYDMLFPVNKGLAQEIWWWTGGIYVYSTYLRILSMPIENIPKLLNSKDESTQVLIEWRLKHGQDI